MYDWGFPLGVCTLLIGLYHNVNTNIVSIHIGWLHSSAPGRRSFVKMDIIGKSEQTEKPFERIMESSSFMANLSVTHITHARAVASTHRLIVYFILFIFFFWGCFFFFDFWGWSYRFILKTIARERNVQKIIYWLLLFFFLCVCSNI